ncbi:DUF3052 domain-containing protein [Luteococcus sanguinis]|uniref:DUF3052 domain-containing protein n=1 Tax=Luteococcus sanguinis TaxID=174038 RepID=A0ABW1WYG9_9ACTN
MKSGDTPANTLMGLAGGMVVQELGWDSDVDESLRDQVMDAIDGDMVEEALEAVDAVLLWWRDEDGDVADGLVDSMTDLAPNGVIWLMTPKVGRSGYVDPADLADGCTTAGMSLTSSVNLADDWQAHKVVRPKGAARG